MSVDHPATYSAEILLRLRELVQNEVIVKQKDLSLLDPMGGVGKIHRLGSVYFLDHNHYTGFNVTTHAIELEPEWADQHRLTRVGDATQLHSYYRPGIFDIIMTSPPYGNRMADHHEAKDDSKRYTYKHMLGRDLTEGNVGELQWGEEYKELMFRIWNECEWVLRPGGLMVVNVKNHVRDFSIQRVVEWHLIQLLALGFYLVEVQQVPTKGLSFGANAKSRVDGEHIIVLRKPEGKETTE